MEITKKDKDLIKNIKYHECSPCILEFRDKHIGLILSIYNRYQNVLYQLNFTNEDFNQEINYLIFEAARTFDLRRKNIKFSSWLGERVKYFCLNKINELNKNKTVNAEPEAIIKMIDDCFNNNNRNKTSELCQYIFSILEQLSDKRILEIFKLRYFTKHPKMTWKEIGKTIIPPITNQTCLNLHNKTLLLLKEKILSKIEHDNI